MKVYLSADLHHTTLQTGNQQHCDITELETGHIFVKLLEKYGVKATCFMTGKCFSEEWETARPICHSKQVEIGGHTWNGFTPVILHRLFNKLCGSYNGPYWYQYADIGKTKRIIEAKTGKPMVVWRNHMYMHGPHTERALAAHGIGLCSDGVNKHNSAPQRHASGLLNFPLNIMPDHEHLYHAERTPEWVAQWQKRYQWSDDFGAESYYIDEWCERVMAQIRTAIKENRDINMLVHPITMYLADGFQQFERILFLLASCETAWLGDIVRAQQPFNSTHQEIAYAAF